MRLIIRLLAVVALLSPISPAQLQDDDIVLSTSIGIVHIRSGAILNVVPVDSTATPIAINWGDGSLLSLPGTDFFLLGEGGGGFSLYLLDFSSSINNPVATLLGNATGGLRSLAYDRSNGDVYALQVLPGGIGEIFQLTGPVTSASTLPAAPMITGQSAAIAIEVVVGSQVIVSSATGIWEADPGDTSTSPMFITINAPASCSDLDYDALNDRIIVATSTASRVDIYTRSTGAFECSPITQPQLLVADAADYDEATSTVYGLSRVSSTIGGIPQYGDQGVFDNVIMAVISPPGGCTTATSGTAIGITPVGGSGTAGGNSGYFDRRKTYAPLVTGLTFDQALSTASFDSMTGMFTASLVVDSILGLPIVTSAATDNLVGATVNMSAAMIGTDTTGLSDIQLGGLTIEIFESTAPPGTPDITMQSLSPINLGPLSEFGGSLMATPTAVRRFDVVAPGVTDNGTGTSASLAGLISRILGGAGLSMDVDVTGLPGSPVNLLLNAAPSGTVFENRAATAGTGDLDFGIINATPGATLINLFTLVIAMPTGSGPFLGLAPDPNLFVQASYPLGTQPFKVLADGNGLYSFNAPATTLPSGLQVDFLTVEFVTTTGSVTILDAQTITF